MRYRTEKDPLGKKKVPADALYGIHTQRAFENFPISGQTLPLELFYAIAELKIACAKANAKLGFLEKKKASLIERASKEILKGLHDDHFVIDQFQAGMGTPTHMNVNEVIANRAAALAKKPKGKYNFIHPNDHVNMGQSTNNIVPSALKITLVYKIHDLMDVLIQAGDTLSKKGRQWKTLTKAGRTHLQDAVPITLGQEFHAHATAVARNVMRLEQLLPTLQTLNAGKNAIGTGINTHPKFTEHICKYLKQLNGIKWTESKDSIYATQYSSDFLVVSSTLRVLASDMNKLSNDLRLLSSGPSAGLNEINLPAVEPGSSIMPGKVNPSMPEMMNMVCYQVMGSDETISQAAQAGQLELNVMMPVIAKNLIESVDLLTNATKQFNKRCLKGIKVNKQALKYYAEHTSGIATLLNPYIGYDKAAAVVQESLKTGLSIPEVALRRKLLTKTQLKSVLNPKKITKPNL